MPLFSNLLNKRLLQHSRCCPEVGPPLINGVNFIGFTGSTATGRIIARQAGERLIHASLELGGKNPAIVLDDADIPKTVERISLRR